MINSKIMSDYVPRSDGDFDNWQNGLRSYVAENRETWEIPEVKVTELNAEAAIWKAKYEKTINRQNRTTAEVRAKDDERVVYVDMLRKFVAQYLTFNDKVLDSDREMMGLNIRSSSRTPAPVPSTSPLASIDISVRMQHTLTIVDSSLPQRRSKPNGVLGCEIWTKIDGDPPKDASELMYQSTATRSTHVVKFDGNKTGMKVYYWLRWINRRQQVGPWSAMYSAVIG